MIQKKSIEKCFQKVDSGWFKRRLFGLMILVFLAFMVLGVRLFYLQIVLGEEYFKLSENNCIRIQRVKPFRGQIFDRNGVPLVENRPSFDLNLIPYDARPVNETISKLAGYMNGAADGVMDKIDGENCGAGFTPIVLKADISRETLAVISAHQFDLPGIVIETNARRHYLFESMAAHLIGYLGEISPRELKMPKFKDYRSGDVIGRFGVEKTFESFLSGVSGGRIVQVNASGQVVKVLDTVEARPGNNIYLTIDHVLQEKAEQLLTDKTGAVVALVPFTGEILAMASSPAFNPNHLVDGISTADWKSLIINPDRPMTNKAVQGVYPPASTYKIVTAVAGLEEGIIDENTAIYCPGRYKYGNRYYGCWKEHGHGNLTVVDAIAQSCDVFFYQVGKRLGVDRLADYARRFGLGASVGIDLDLEAEGLIPTADWKLKRFGIPWQGGENLSIAIGQGYNLVTPLQMAVLTAAVANGGTVYKPRLFNSISTVEGQCVRKGEPEIIRQLGISEKSLRLVQKGMFEVVHGRHGTARTYVNDKEVDISGKTGTAQVVSRRISDKVKNRDEDPRNLPHAWFIGYAPSDHPEIAISVLIENGEHGSSSAGPIAKELILIYLNKHAECDAGSGIESVKGDL